MVFFNHLLLACSLSLIWASPSFDKNNEKADASAKNRARSVQEKKPNVLLIMADDVGTGDIPSYWNSSLINMPNLNRLATMGVSFKDAHSTSLCAPSRYMLLSGNYAHRGQGVNGSWGLKSDKNQFRNGQKSIAEVLRDKGGYHTAMLGKWGIGAKVAPSGMQPNSSKRILTHPRHNWDLPVIGGPQDIGFDSSYMTIGGIQNGPYSFFRDGYLTTKPSKITFWEEGQHKSPNGISVIFKGGEGGVQWDTAAYNMIVVKETMKFIDHHLETRKDDPFFAYVALGAAHLPHSPPIAYLDGSPVHNEYRTRHLDMLLEMDKAVGSLITKIEEEGLANNTVIIFTSDNGGLARSDSLLKGSTHLTSGPMRGEKGQILEGGHRVPLMIRYDGTFPQNEEMNHLVGLSDIYRTVTDLAGIDEIPYGSAQDSVSFANYLASGNNTSGLRQHIGNWLYKKGGGEYNKEIDAHAVRNGNMKLIHNVTTSTYELYDLDNDLSENIDLSHNVSYAELIHEMYEKLIELGPCPDDIDGSFSLSNSRESDEEVNCKWFNTQTTTRCNMHIEGELLCNSVCGRYGNVCKALRASEPEATCTDSKLLMLVGKDARSCNWVSKDVKKRCRIRGVASHCAVTCDKAQFCTKDSSKKFRSQDGNKIWSCKWLKKSTVLRCKKAGLAGTCRKSCQ